MADYPVGKAQKMVLDALGMTANGFNDADQKFTDIGIAVSSKRVGRSSQPVVRVVGFGGGFNAYGEGEAWSKPSVNLEAINQWIEEA